MPLNTQIVRNGESLPLRWGDFHVAAMVQAATIDSGQGPYVDNADVQKTALRLMEEQGNIAITPDQGWRLASYDVIGATPLNHGEWTMTRRLVFIDVTDGEELELLPGDVLKMSRSSF